MSSCKLTCVRKKKKQTANLNEVDEGQELVEGSHPTIPVPSQQLPTTSSGRSIFGSSSPRVKGLCKAEACPEHCPKAVNTIKDKALIFWKNAKDLWKKTNDPFHWQLFKSVTMFTFGLKLFNDLYRHMTKDL